VTIEESNMRSPSSLLAAALLLLSAAISAGSTLNVKPTEPLSVVRDKLAADAGIAEVVFAEGVYFGGLSVEGPQGTDFSRRPLLIRGRTLAGALDSGSAACRHVMATSVAAAAIDDRRSSPRMVLLI